LDSLLEIEDLPHKKTKKCAVETAYWGQNQSSFEEAKSAIEKDMDIKISKETIRKVTEEIGRQIYELDTLKAKNTYENMAEIEMAARPQKAALYVMMDGAMVNTRVEDENGSTWRENKTVMVFKDKDMIRRKNGDHIITKKEYMPLIGSAEEFRKYVLDTAVRNGYGTVSEVVVVADGAHWIWNLCEDVFPDAVEILDLFHLKENIYAYGKYLYNQDAKQYVPWADSVITDIEAGNVDAALQKIPEKEKSASGVVNLREYIEHNRKRINYKEYKEKGYIVGSGAIESANKTVVQRRLKRAGMRWSVKGAQAVLRFMRKKCK
jgi:hypothetical protein